MLSRAFASLAKHQIKHPLDLPVHASTALRRACGSLLQHKSKSPLDLSNQASAAFRRCSYILQQVHQLHHRPVRPDSLPQEQPLRTDSRGARPACMLEPNDSVDGSFDQRFATLRSIGECSSDYELMLLLKKKTAPICYVWCDPSPWMHITQADIWLLGLDHRGAYILARQYCKPIERENRPIALFHNVLPNLLKYPEYESWDPRWAIFMEDDEEIIIRKIRNAFCPPKFSEGNPCLEYIKYIIFPWFGKFEVARKEENGSNKTFLNMEELTADYESGALHPADVKQALVNAINMILKPVHDHFRSSAEGREVIKAMEKFHIGC